ncbi:MAG: M6 family metalloprotease domain-containing protein, partial [Planctomycetota bacterium]
MHSVVFAGPANPATFTVKQPDGSEFQARLKGDEWVNWAETTERYPIVRNNATGFWEYGELQPNIGLAPSGKVVGSDLPEGINKISANDIRTSVPEKGPGSLDIPFSSPELPQPAPLNILGTANLLVILVNFADQTLTTTESSWSSRAFGATDSVKDYFDEVSYNQLTFAPATESYGTANNGVVIVTLAYNHPNTDTGTASRQVANDAIIAADFYVNFASYDTDSNGKITTNELHIMVVWAGYESSCGGSPSPKAWAHKYSLATPPTVDGKIVGGSPGGYTRMGELHWDHQATIGTMIHELGHDLGTATIWLGLPDLYDTDYSSEGVGDWCSMAGGCNNGVIDSGDSPAHFSAWCKWYLGWITPSQITSNQTGVSFPRVEDAIGTDRGVKQFLSNPGGPDIGGIGEYFLIENRQLTGYDAKLPYAGILIWHIDETQSGNTNEARKLVDLEEADGLNQLDNNTNSGNAGDPYPGTANKRIFNNISNPNSQLYSGANSGIYIGNISNSLSIMTADIVIAADGPPVLTSPGNKSVNENQLLTFTLSAIDPDLDVITYSATGLPAGASLITATGVFTWTPDYAQAGSYVVTFTATAALLFDDQAITITVNNTDRPPVLTSPGDKSVNENQLLTFTLSAIDPDLDVITYSATGLPAGASLITATGVFSWTPDYAQAGSYMVTFTATAALLSDDQAITITVNNVNGPPVLTSPGNKGVTENYLLTFTLSAIDPDLDVITYSATG